MSANGSSSYVTEIQAKYHLNCEKNSGKKSRGGINQAANPSLSHTLWMLRQAGNQAAIPLSHTL